MAILLYSSEVISPGFSVIVSNIYLAHVLVDILHKWGMFQNG